MRGHNPNWAETGVGGQNLSSRPSVSRKATIRGLAGYAIRADRVTGPKEVRAAPFAAQCEAGNVQLLAGSWNAAYLDELCLSPTGHTTIRVDASSGAFSKLIQKRKFAVGV